MKYGTFQTLKANHVEKSDHPCQYPIELVERCLLALTDEFDWVLDPLCWRRFNNLSLFKK
jgi:DNA modification methylase